jgi:hypothetical protein
MMGEPRRFRDGRLVVDATANLNVYVTPEDVEDAIPRSFTNCAIARAVARTCGMGARAEIMRTVAYIFALDEDGVEVATRYIIPPKTSEAIRHYDSQNPANEFNTRRYVLHAPTKCLTLPYRLEMQRARDKVRKDREPTTGRRYRERDTVSMLGTIRNGSGQFHNTIEEGGRE